MMVWQESISVVNGGAVGVKIKYNVCGGHTDDNSRIIVILWCGDGAVWKKKTGVGIPTPDCFYERNLVVA